MKYTKVFLVSLLLLFGLVLVFSTARTKTIIYILDMIDSVVTPTQESLYVYFLSLIDCVVTPLEESLFVYFISITDFVYDASAIVNIFLYNMVISDSVTQNPIEFSTTKYVNFLVNDNVTDITIPVIEENNFIIYFIFFILLIAILILARIVL